MLYVFHSLKGFTRPIFCLAVDCLLNATLEMYNRHFIVSVGTRIQQKEVPKHNCYPNQFLGQVKVGLSAVETAKENFLS